MGGGGQSGGSVGGARWGNLGWWGGVAQGLGG